MKDGAQVLDIKRSESNEERCDISKTDWLSKYDKFQRVTANNAKIQRIQCIEEVKHTTHGSVGESIQLKEYQVCMLCSHIPEKMEHFFSKYGQYLRREELIELLWDVHGDIELAEERLEVSMKEVGIRSPKGKKKYTPEVFEVIVDVHHCLGRSEYQLQGFTHAHVVLHDLGTE